MPRDNSPPTTFHYLYRYMYVYTYKDKYILWGRIIEKAIEGESNPEENLLHRITAWVNRRHHSQQIARAPLNLTTRDVVLQNKTKQNKNKNKIRLPETAQVTLSNKRSCKKARKYFSNTVTMKSTSSQLC